MLRYFREIPLQSLRLIVFDLDGTLIDSRQDLCNSVNATLTHFGLRALADDVILLKLHRRRGDHAHPASAGDSRPVAGRSPRRNSERGLFRRSVRLFSRLLPGSQAGLHASLPRCHRVSRCVEDFTGRRACVPMAVLTNKPVRPRTSGCAGLGLTQYFFQYLWWRRFPNQRARSAGSADSDGRKWRLARETLMGRGLRRGRADSAQCRGLGSRMQLRARAGIAGRGCARRDGRSPSARLDGGAGWAKFGCKQKISGTNFRFETSAILSRICQVNPFTSRISCGSGVILAPFLGFILLLSILPCSLPSSY